MPDYDFRKLSTEKLHKICIAGEREAGYKAVQTASALIIRRQSVNKKIRAGQTNESFLRNLTEDEIATIQKVLEIMPD